MRNLIPVVGCFFMAVAGSASASIDLNGGASWGGWTSYGLSDASGVYGTGSNATVYEIYQTVFTFNNDSVTLGAGYSGGGTSGGFGSTNPALFANGNLIYGLGVRRVSGTSALGTATIGFDLGNDSYQAASASGGARVSTSAWSQNRDFNVQAFGAAGFGTQIGVQLGNGTSYSGTSNFVYSGNSGGIEFAMRAFGNTENMQIFFDVTAMNALYTQAGAFGGWTTGINTIGEYFRLSLDTGGMGARTAIQSIQVPAPGALALLGLAGLAGKRRRR